MARIKVEKMSDGQIRISASGPVIDIETAKTAHDFHKNPCEIFVGVKGGIKRKIENWRRNGQTQLWKTRPGDFRVPVKYGLKSTDQLTNSEAGLLHDAANCPLAHIDADEAQKMAAECRKGADFVTYREQ